MLPMTCDLLITGGTVCNAQGMAPADVAITGERIDAVGPPGSLAHRRTPGHSPATTIIDASGCLVCPGFIDPHVHIHLPFMGTAARDDHDSASRAALAGGTTTLIEMICPGPRDEPMTAFEDWATRAARSWCDYSFHLGIVRFDDLARDQLRRIVAEHAITSFKVFLAYKGALDISDEALFGVMTLARELGCTVTAHCENAEAVHQMQRRLLAQGKAEPRWHEPSRPAFIEALGVRHFAAFLQLTGATGYIVHTSCRDAVEAAVAARQQGVRLHIEAVAPHLALDRSLTDLDGFEGAKYVMSPPLRESSHVRSLWDAVSAGIIDTIATDHAPFDFVGQKDMGRGDFTKIPNGIPSIQERILLVHTLGVATGLITAPQMVDLCSTRAARIFGLYPRKGVIAPGSDADIAILDPRPTGRFSKQDAQSRVDYSAFEGRPRQGAITHTILRGRIRYQDGKCVGAPGGGTLIPRSPADPASVSPMETPR